jgi:hypothetical protein
VLTVDETLQTDDEHVRFWQDIAPRATLAVLDLERATGFEPATLSLGS